VAGEDDILVAEGLQLAGVRAARPPVALRSAPSPPRDPGWGPGEARCGEERTELDGNDCAPAALTGPPTAARTLDAHRVSSGAACTAHRSRRCVAQGWGPCQDATSRLTPAAYTTGLL
jgi:hypothetical protein